MSDAADTVPPCRSIIILQIAKPHLVVAEIAQPCAYPPRKCLIGYFIFIQSCTLSNFYRGHNNRSNRKVALNSALMLRSPPSPTQVGCSRLAHSIGPISGRPEIGGRRQPSRTMARGSERAAILRDACLRQGEDKLLRMRAECVSSAAGRTHRWPTQDGA